jgi:hypothetical protein
MATAKFAPGVREVAIEADPVADTGTSGTNAAVSLSYAAAIPNQASPKLQYKHSINGICWSYNAAPTAGAITIKSGNDVIFTIDITAAGPGFVPLKLSAKPGESMTITLAAGGGTAVGKINAQGHLLEPSVQ